MADHVYCRHVTEIEVPFFDVDSMRIVWHGHYVKYLETARCDFLASIDYDYGEMERQGYMWPIVQMALKYVKPAKFGQKILVETAVVEIESCLRIKYTIRDAASDAKLTQASTTQAAVSLENGELQFQTPSSWLAAVRRHPSFRPAE